MSITIRSAVAAMVALVLLGPAARCSNPASSKASDTAVSVTRRTGPDGRRWIKARVSIHAPKEVVWMSVRASRGCDPDLFHSSVLERSGHDATVQEKMRLPLIGSEVYTVKVTPQPFERIDYKLVKSNRLKAYEGNWRFLAGDSDRSSILELEHHVRPAFFVPSFLLESFVGRRLERRLLNVKRFAEQERTQ